MDGLRLLPIAIAGLSFHAAIFATLSLDSLVK
jgi:hypothetical protein